MTKIPKLRFIITKINDNAVTRVTLWRGKNEEPILLMCETLKDMIKRVANLELENYDVFRLGIDGVQNSLDILVKEKPRFDNDPDNDEEWPIHGLFVFANYGYFHP